MVWLWWVGVPQLKKQVALEPSFPWTFQKALLVASRCFVLFDAEINEWFNQISLVICVIWSISTILIHLHLPAPICLKMNTTFAHISTRKELLSSIVLKKKSGSSKTLLVIRAGSLVSSQCLQILRKLFRPLVSSSCNFSNTVESSLVYRSHLIFLKR